MNTYKNEFKRLVQCIKENNMTDKFIELLSNEDGGHIKTKDGVDIYYLFSPAAQVLSYLIPDNNKEKTIILVSLQYMVNFDWLQELKKVGTVVKIDHLSGNLCILGETHVRDEEYYKLVFTKQGLTIITKKMDDKLPIGLDHKTELMSNDTTYITFTSNRFSVAVTKHEEDKLAHPKDEMLVPSNLHTVMNDYTFNRKSDLNYKKLKELSINELKDLSGSNGVLDNIGKFHMLRFYADHNLDLNMILQAMKYGQEKLNLHNLITHDKLIEEAKYKLVQSGSLDNYTFKILKDKKTALLFTIDLKVIEDEHIIEKMIGIEKLYIISTGDNLEKVGTIHNTCKMHHIQSCIIVIDLNKFKNYNSTSKVDTLINTSSLQIDMNYNNLQFFENLNDLKLKSKGSEVVLYNSNCNCLALFYIIEKENCDNGTKI